MNGYNNYCCAVWCAAQSPEDFRYLFEASWNQAQFWAALAQRIDEVLDGTSDRLGEDRDRGRSLEEKRFQINAWPWPWPRPGPAT